MLVQIPYNPQKAVEYAETWAMKRNPRYLNFNGIGGDCTNFASQCLFAGCGIMNYTPNTGWYYNSPKDRTAAWSGVEYLYRFLVGNKSAGPYAEETNPDGICTGDLVQLGDSSGHFYHTPIVISAEDGNILVAAHSYDVYGRPLTDYSFARLRCIHIAGCRQWR